MHSLCWHELHTAHLHRIHTVKTVQNYTIIKLYYTKECVARWPSG